MRSAECGGGGREEFRLLGRRKRDFFCMWSLSGVSAGWDKGKEGAFRTMRCDACGKGWGEGCFSTLLRSICSCLQGLIVPVGCVIDSILYHQVGSRVIRFFFGGGAGWDCGQRG